MMVRLNEKEQTLARRQLLTDVVWVICHDSLLDLKKDGKTKLAPVELFLSARQFANTLMSLPDMEEGLDDEMADLEDKVEGEDAMIIALLASAQMIAISKKRIDLNFRDIIKRIFMRWENHELFFTLIEKFADKEESRWLAGKQTDLLNYELQEIELNGGGSEDVRQLVKFVSGMDNGSITGFLSAFNDYNIANNHAYDDEINSLYTKLREPKIVNANNYIEAHDNQMVNFVPQ